MGKTIVLTTGGKRKDVYLVKVNLFDTIQDAEKFCKEVNVNKDKWYWERADIINSNLYYETSQEKLFPRKDYDEQPLPNNP